MIHPGIGGALGAGAGLASSSGSTSQQKELTDPFVQASDFALNIAADGLLTEKNLKVLNFDFVAQINQLINEVNQLQSTVGSIDSDIVGVKNEIITIQQELARQQHFRGYYLLNTHIQNLLNSADGDFAFNAESGTVWMYSDEWYNSGDIVADQVTPASDAVPLVDSGAGFAGISNEYSRGDHQHRFQISSVLPSANTAEGQAGTAATYARSDHTHHVNLSYDIYLKDSGTGTACTSNIYACSQHQHPLNVDQTVANVPLVNAAAAVNDTSDYYCRNDHVHLQQLTYDGNITATKFIKTGGTNQQILLADGINESLTDFNTSVAPRAYQIDPADGIYWLCFAVLTIPNYTSNGSYGYTMDINTTYVVDLFYQIMCNLRIQNDYNRKFEVTQFGQVQTDFMICADTHETSLILRFYMKVFSDSTYILFNINLSQLSGSNVRDNFILQDNINQFNIITDTLPTGSLFTGTAIQTQFKNQGGIIKGNTQINSSTGNYSEGLRIANNNNNISAIYIGTSSINTAGSIDGQWSIFKKGNGTLNIERTADQNVANGGLSISVDGNSLSFNGSVIAGSGATNGATNGSVNYSAGNPILWGVNSTGTEGGFYSDGPKVYWRVKQITLGSVPR
ncbi:MAG: hypothetical protein EZS28_003362 [Streblomastix strix]|uniref:Uncharacterized protein n=1 Tax=Streblomastix strix TaxID=222440 RepID=A0A5J4X294_9EUKA|nr:MAG: hypothetical protein EZS28_003362 [Streblomastix strix]